MYHPQIVRAVQNYVDQDKDGERVGEQGGGHELSIFWVGGWASTLTSPDVFRLGDFQHELHFR